MSQANCQASPQTRLNLASEAIHNKSFLYNKLATNYSTITPQVPWVGIPVTVAKVLAWFLLVNMHET
jgi:hypothetical protein